MIRNDNAIQSIQPLDQGCIVRPFAIFVHVFYLDIWEAIVERLEQTVREPFHIVVSAPSHIADRLHLPTSHLIISSQIIVCENRGRDVRPFCQSLRIPIDFDIGLKLHTKRSIHRLDGVDWGQSLIRDLLPMGDSIQKLHESMIANPKIVLVSPNGMLVSQNNWMNSNKPLMINLAQYFSINLDECLSRTPVFCAGNMFWFRKDALTFLTDWRIDELFEPETGQVDGTVAHALERLIAPIAEQKGGVVTTVDGALTSKNSSSTTELRKMSRSLADQPNAFLFKPRGLAGFVASTPVLRDIYRTLSVSWRRQLKKWLLPRRYTKS